MKAPKEEGGIQGVVLDPLRIIPVEGGAVLHMLRVDSSLFRAFGEVYFSEIGPGIVRAWKRHLRQTQHFAVPAGRLRVVLYDGREESPSAGSLYVVLLGRPDAYALLRIPPGIWYGFSAVGEDTALIANCTDMPHMAEETERLPRDSGRIPYHW
jgi:dTDP-4-dehydrorhamnose 3,5-epimerase